jgi:hypothetical protein
VGTVAKKVVDSDDTVLKNGLLALAAANGPRRLIGKGEHPPVYGNGAPDKRAAKTCTGRVPPLVTVDGTAKKAIVRLTAAGFNLIADAIPGELVGPRAKEIAERLPAAERIDFLQSVVARAPIATAELLPVLEAAVAEERAEREAESARQSKRVAAETASLAALERWKATLATRRQDEIAALHRQLAALGGNPEKRPQSQDRPVPQTKDDRLFRRDVANQLASSWEATWAPDRPDIREYLESAMWNVRGLRTLGDVGEQTTFDGERHAAVRGVFPGDAVRITRPGWILEEGEDAEYVVLKALIDK